MANRSAEADALLRVVRFELDLHPSMLVSDLQKLAYQAAMGAEHFRSSPGEAHRSILAEWRALRVSDWRDVAPIQVIDPEGRTARLHLGPCRLLGIAPAHVADIFLRQPPKSARAERCDHLWRLLRDLSAEGLLPWSVDDLSTVGAPEAPPSHSEAYGPASYRVLNDVREPLTADWLSLHNVHVGGQR